MAGDLDAAEIQKERERRRTAERLRISRDREARRAEAARLRAGEAAGGGPPPAPRSPSETPAGPALGSSARRPTTGGPTSVPPRSGREGVPAARSIGAPIVVPELRAFLALDPTDRFDLQEVNSVRLSGLARAAGVEPGLLREIAVRAGALMARVKQEVDDPLNAGAFLRERILEWYRSSPGVPDWPASASSRWSGLFADSRSAGGKLHPWLNHRLRALREEVARSGPVGSRLRQSLMPDRLDRSTTSRAAHQQILAEVAQAILDDLAARPREGSSPCPLVHLSELAVRRQVATVNDALAALFSSPESGPFVVLHPNRYPEVEEVVIRPPVAAATGAALAYRLVPGGSGRKGAARGRAADGSLSGEGGDAGGEGGEFDAEEEGASIWDASNVEEATWLRLVEARRRDRHRLDTPPKDYRQRAAYEPLRTLVVGHAEFRKQFLAVKWRGRPAGLPLLAALLQRGKLAPEVATDHEYLDAELEGLVGDDAGAKPTPDSWTFSGWTVKREGSHAEGFRYAAAHEGAGA